MTVLSYARLAEQILASPPRLGRARLVCVDGPAGSGKSTFAGRLVGALRAWTALGTDVPLVHMDDVFEGWQGLSTAGRKLADQVLLPLQQGRPAGYLAFDWAAGRYGGRRDVPVADVLVVEGCGSADRLVDDVATLRVWVHVPRQLRLERGIARDGAAMTANWDNWMGQELMHYAGENTPLRCDIVVSGNPRVRHDPSTQFVTGTRDVAAQPTA